MAKAKTSTRSKRATKTATKTKSTAHVCACGEKNAKNFYTLQSGGLSAKCKVCSRKASKEWTTARANLRLAQQEARKYIRNGIPAIVPDAKTWVEGSPILTYEYEENGKTVKSQEAKPLYDAIIAERDRIRAEAKAQKEAELEAERAEKRKAREERKAQREAQLEAERVAKRKEREKRKAERAKAQAKKNREIKETKRKKSLAKAKKAKEATLQATGKAS